LLKTNIIAVFSQTMIYAAGAKVAELFGGQAGVQHCSIAFVHPSSLYYLVAPMNSILIQLIEEVASRL